MKTIIIIFFSIFFIGMTNQSDAKPKKMDEFTVQVDGLGCPFCAYGLEKKFKELKGIKNIKIDIETGVMTFKYPSKKMLTIKQVESQVEKSGYTPMKVVIIRSDGEKEATETGQELEKKPKRETEIEIPLD